MGLHFNFPSQRVFIADGFYRHQLKTTFTKHHGGKFNHLPGFDTATMCFLKPAWRHRPTVLGFQLAVSRQEGAGRRYQRALQLAGKQGDGSHRGHSDNQGNQDHPNVSFAPVPAYGHELL